MTEQVYNLQLRPGGAPPIVHCSQYDVIPNAIKFMLVLDDARFTEDGYSAKVEGTKPDHRAFSYDARIDTSGSYKNAVVHLVEQMTCVKGMVRCKLKLTKNSEVVYTAPFILMVDANAIDDDVDISETVLPEYIDAAQRAAQEAASCVDSSEAWARGTRNGTPVSQSDETYQNNSKYYSEQSAAQVSLAAEQATLAAAQATAAAGSATTADTNAKNAEAWAVGKRGGTDVPSSDQTYHNNSKYYSEQAAGSAQAAAASVAQGTQVDFWVQGGILYIQQTIQGVQQPAVALGSVTSPNTDYKFATVADMNTAIGNGDVITNGMCYVEEDGGSIWRNEAGTAVEYASLRTIGSRASGSTDGAMSFAQGYQNTASGYGSSAQGYQTQASAYYTHSEGRKSVASANYAHAEGDTTTADGERAHAEGYNTTSSGSGSHAEGEATTASGGSAHAEGLHSSATAAGAHSEGFYTQATGHSSHAEGYQGVASGQATHAEGYHVVASANYAHAEGNNTQALTEGSHAEGLNAIAGDSENLSNSKYAHAEGNSTVASGSASHAEGSACQSTGSSSHAEGNHTTATSYAHSEGSYTQASGSYSHAEGYYAVASGEGSHAEGRRHASNDTHEASGKGAHVEGWSCIASGAASHAEGWGSQATSAQAHAQGQGTIANKANIHVSGSFNKASESATDVMIIGNGTNNDYRSNCFRVTSVGVYGNGAYNSSGADYAEYFEWLDGNMGVEDRAGRFVTLYGDKIRLANANDDFILGIVSGNASVIGDSHDDQWAHMYERDVFGRYIFEDVMVPAVTAQITEELSEVIVPEHMEHRLKLNPAYDNTQIYLPRSQRTEWDAVGMVGKLVALDDGTCQVNGYCTPGENGIATAAEGRTRYRVIKRLGEYHIQVVIV